MNLTETTRMHPVRRAIGRAALCAGVFTASVVTAGALQSASSEVVMIRMQTGVFHWGTIEDHTPEEVTFKRLDTSGMVTMPWTMMEAEQKLDLRTQFGYVDLSEDEVLVSAGKLLLGDGREIIGLVIDRTGEVIKFQTEGRLLEIPKSLVRNYIVGLQVPALDVYTREDLYRERERATDFESPQAQFDLAAYCERILDYPHALQHYQAVLELDPEFMAKELAGFIARVQIRVDSQQQVDALAHIDHLKRRKRYDEALTKLVEFDANFVDSPLRTDRLKMEERVIKARSDYMHVQVAKVWFSWMGRLAAKAGREKSYDATLAYLDEGLSEEISRHVTETMRKTWVSVEEDQVRQFFIERKPGRWKPASYGLGTWLLGEEEALKGGVVESKEAKPQSSRDKERAAQAEKINRWLRNQEMAKRSRKSEDDLEEVENAWSLLQSSARRNWIVAYYAENSGDLEVRTKPELRNCSECGGTGVREIIYTGNAREGTTSGRQNIPCPTCHGIGRVRRIRYR